MSVAFSSPVYVPLLSGVGRGRDGGWKECELLSRVVIQPNRAGTEESIQGLHVILGMVVEYHVLCLRSVI